MPKFFVKNEQVNGDEVNIIGEDVKHISNVLRMQVEDEFYVCNVDKAENFLVKIVEIDKSQIVCNIIEKIESEAESNIDINIFQGVPKSDKMELIIQKSTELGVKRITPVQMERCVSKLSSKDESKKIDRWQKIAEVAAKQSGRDMIPNINFSVKIDDICKEIGKYDLIIVPYEKEQDCSFKEAVDELKEIVQEPKNEMGQFSVGIVIGPEGGFEPGEIDCLRNAGAKIVSLGKRILRTETVALAMVSVIMYELGGNI